MNTVKPWCQCDAFAGLKAVTLAEGAADSLLSQTSEDDRIRTGWLNDFHNCFETFPICDHEMIGPDAVVDRLPCRSWSIRGKGQHCAVFRLNCQTAATAHDRARNEVHGWRSHESRNEQI